MNEYGFYGKGLDGYVHYSQAVVEAERPRRRAQPKMFDLQLEKVPSGVFYFILVFGLVLAAAID